VFRSVVLPVALLGLLCALRVGLWTAVAALLKLSLSLFIPAAREHSRERHGASEGFW